MVVRRSKDPFRVKAWYFDTYKGSTRVKRFFATETEAKEEEAKFIVSPVSKRGWDKIKVRFLLEKYRDEITPTKRGAVNETYRLNYLLNNNPGKMLCGYSLSQLVERVQGWAYIRARQRQISIRGTPVTMRTISRERNLLQDVFRVAIEEWGYVGLTNPFFGLKLKGSKFKRTRRLEDGEYERLLEHSKTCHGLNRSYMPLAIDIAIETGLREEEVFNLEWGHIDFDNRIIIVVKSKTDDGQVVPGRKIPLPFNTLVDLVCLKSTLEYEGIEVKTTDRIFPMTQSALIQSFEKVVNRAEIEDLTYRDLRHEANSRWDDIEPALTLTQRKTMLGQMGSSGEINDVYSQSNLKIIRQKLDRQAIQMTFEEKFKDELLNGFSVHDIVKTSYWEPAIYFNSHKDANESFDTTFNAPPPNQEQKQIFAKTRELIDSLGDNPTEEQVKQLLDHFKNTRKAFSLKPKSEVKKLKLVPRNKEWSMEDTTGSK